MRVEASVDSISNAGVEVVFRVRGLPRPVHVTEIITERADAKTFDLRPPAGFHEGDAEIPYTSLEEFMGDYLQDHPDASPERIQKAFVAAQRRSRKENARTCAFTGRLKLKWFGPTRLLIPMNASAAGSITLGFVYRFLYTPLLWTWARGAISVTMTLPDNSLKTGGNDGKPART